jgi:hypothetical protein
MVLMVLALVGQRMGLAEESTSSLAVKIETEAGTPITTERYLAVVPVDQPWSEPWAEAIVAEGAPPPSVNLLPGAYRVACSAAGYGVLYQPYLVRPEPGVSKVLECKLRELSAMHGQVLSASGDKIPAGAVIVPAFLWQEEFPFRLSAAGMALLDRNFRAVADEQGRFTLHGVAGFKADFWVVAPGFSPVLLPDLTFGKATELPPLRLTPGGSLALRLKLPANFPAGQYLAGLREPRQGSVLAPEAKKQTVQELLLSPLSGESPEIVYAALPAGTFEVWLKPRQGSDPALAPVTLGTATIAAGARTALTLDVPAPIAAPSPPGSREMKLFAAQGPQLKELRTGLVLVRWKGAEVRPVVVRERPVSGGLRIQALVPCEEGAHYFLNTATLLSEPISAPGGCGPVEAALALHPAAEVKGQLRVPAGMQRPKSGSLGVAVCGEPQGRDIGSYPVSSDAQGHWHAPVVAGCSELTLKTSFAPAVWHDLVLQPGEHRDLGEQRLDAGASLLVRVVTGDGQPAAAVALELVPEAELARAVAGAASGLPVKARARASSDVQGWGRFVSLAAGSYSVHAVPKTGLPTFSEVVTLGMGEEATLDDLVLQQAANVEVVVEGSLDRLPAGTKLTVQATGAESCGWKSLQRATAELDAEHKAHLQLYPGSWDFKLAMADGHSHRYELSHQREEIPAGGFRRVRLEAGHHLFHGTVTGRDDQPVTGDLVLRSRSAEDHYRVAADTGVAADGTYSLFLEDSGHFAVEVFPHGGSRAWLSNVAFDDDSQPVDIHLPQASIGGLVKDGKGQPIGGAKVTANLVLDTFGRPVELTAQSGADGTYLLDDVEPGQYALVAETKDKSSDAVRVTLEASDVRKDQDLTVDTSPQLRGTVVAHGQPISGALGQVICLWSDPQNQCGGAFRSGDAGDFSLVLQPAPDGATVNVELSTPGLPLNAYRLPVTSDPQTLVVPDTGGRVRMLGPRKLLEYGRGRLFLVNDGGGMLSLSTGQVQAQPGDLAELVLPSLAAGHWSLTQVGGFAEVAGLYSTGAGGMGVLASFDVVPGSSVDVPLPPGGTN